MAGKFVSGKVIFRTEGDVLRILYTKDILIANIDLSQTTRQQAMRSITKHRGWWLKMVYAVLMSNFTFRIPNPYLVKEIEFIK